MRFQSGYVGGDALYALLEAHPDWEENITCLLRDRTQGAAFRLKWPKLNLFYATLDDETAIKEEVKKNNLVLHFAVSSDHIAACNAIVKGISVNGGHYIHTSGMDVLLDPSLQTGSPSPVQIFDDFHGIVKLRSLPGMHSDWWFSIQLIDYLYWQISHRTERLRSSFWQQEPISSRQL